MVRRLALVAAAALIPVLTGCEAGNNAPTLSFHPPTETAATTVGDLAIRNVFVLGAPLGRTLTAGQSASVFLSLVITNGAPDKLISITAPGTASSVTLPANTTVVSGHPVFFSGPRPQIVLTNLRRTVTSGSTIRLVLTFEKAGPITMLVPVFARATHYVTYAPPQPVVTPTVKVVVRHRAHAGSSASASPTPSPTTTATPIPTPSPSTTP
jgi:copper(I)-binding protein